MSKRIIYLIDDQRKKYAYECIQNAPEDYVCTIQERTRTLEQNAYQWPYLEGFSKQLQWCVNGEKVWMSNEEWKDVLTSAYEDDVMPRLAAGFDGGGVVMLGRRTSKYGKKKFAEWMEWLIAAASLRGVEPVFKNNAKKWRDQS
ncbi:recombination protein NinB [uncultured Paraglaciecola sp.]|uniref:recombination protein NinB n=1 Tax=uncultured Paraglaciecola sp. TaxID=1765024 RepID=UPI002615C325|nr:recombination protein NinB [uncultured Paraglaciecola sp.]